MSISSWWFSSPPLSLQVDVGEKFDDTPPTPPPPPQQSTVSKTIPTPIQNVDTIIRTARDQDKPTILPPPLTSPSHMNKPDEKDSQNANPPHSAPPSLRPPSPPPPPPPTTFIHAAEPVLSVIKIEAQVLIEISQSTDNHPISSSSHLASNPNDNPSSEPPHSIKQTSEPPLSQTSTRSAPPSWWTLSAARSTTTVNSAGSTSMQRSASAAAAVSAVSTFSTPGGGERNTLRRSHSRANSLDDSSNTLLGEQEDDPVRKRPLSLTSPNPTSSLRSVTVPRPPTTTAPPASSPDLPPSNPAAARPPLPTKRSSGSIPAPNMKSAPSISTTSTPSPSPPTTRRPRSGSVSTTASSIPSQSLITRLSTAPKAAPDVAEAVVIATSAAASGSPCSSRPQSPTGSLDTSAAKLLARRVGDAEPPAGTSQRKRGESVMVEVTGAMNEVGGQVVTSPASMSGGAKKEGKEGLKSDSRTEMSEAQTVEPKNTGNLAASESGDKDQRRWTWFSSTSTAPAPSLKRNTSEGSLSKSVVAAAEEKAADGEGLPMVTGVTGEGEAEATVALPEPQPIPTSATKGNNNEGRPSSSLGMTPPNDTSNSLAQSTSANKSAWTYFFNGTSPNPSPQQKRVEDQHQRRIESGGSVAERSLRGLLIETESDAEARMGTAPIPIPGSNPTASTTPPSESPPKRGPSSTPKPSSHVVKVKSSSASLRSTWSTSSGVMGKTLPIPAGTGMVEVTVASVPKPPNMVLPTFESQFVCQPESPNMPSPPVQLEGSSSSSTSASQNAPAMVSKAFRALSLFWPIGPVSGAPPQMSERGASTIERKNSLTPTLKERSMSQALSGVDPWEARMTKFMTDVKAEGGNECKRFAIIGVHGWFPMKLVRSVIGEPTGTSLKFCEQMAKGLKQYFHTAHCVTIPDSCITLVPLEGEGKVDDRVARLYQNLTANVNWLEAVSSADVVFVATHSQGTPVSTLLLKKLLTDGRIHVKRQRVCMLAMAGISHGPFPFLKENILVKYFEADAARELFEFMDSSTDIATKYREALAYNLHAGVRTVLVGSMQDQVVPLYSAIMTGTSHPSLLRAIYIDGHVFSENDFLINLIIFALRLRNAGVSDHGLIIHLSEVLAGNLYALEGGHSTIYEEVEVYALAARYLFETAPFGNMVVGRKEFEEPKTALGTSDVVTIIGSGGGPLQGIEPIMETFQARTRLNPFYLPWAMRGICDDARVVEDEVLGRELKALMKLFEEWDPVSPKMKEIKFRLEPLRARL